MQVVSLPLRGYTTEYQQLHSSGMAKDYLLRHELQSHSEGTKAARQSEPINTLNKDKAEHP